MLEKKINTLYYTQYFGVSVFLGLKDGKDIVSVGVVVVTSFEISTSLK